jgi:hypothetical protein
MPSFWRASSALMILKASGSAVARLGVGHDANARREERAGTSRAAKDRRSIFVRDENNFSNSNAGSDRASFNTDNKRVSNGERRTEQFVMRALLAAARWVSARKQQQV